ARLRSNARGRSQAQAEALTLGRRFVDFSSPQPSLQASKNPHFMGISGVKPDHRHCLLRARRERPRGPRAAEQRDEVEPFHVWLTSSNFDVCCPERRRDRAPAINASLGGGRVVPIGSGIAAAPKRPMLSSTGQTTI